MPANKPAMPEANATIDAIYRYPVKGLSPEPLARTQLQVMETLPADRLYAIENGPSGFEPAAPRHQPKQRYLMLMRNERLARLRTRFYDTSHTLTIETEAEIASGARMIREGNGSSFVLLRVKPTEPPSYKRDLDPANTRARFRAANVRAKS